MHAVAAGLLVYGVSRGCIAYYRVSTGKRGRSGLADLPMIEGATGKFLLHQMAVVASWKPKRVPAAAAAGPGFP
jgi:hypothetical protein